MRISTLHPAIEDPAAKDGRIFEDRRARALKTLRQGNYAIILRELAKLELKHGARLLEVGSAHGWFLEAAAKCGYDVHGIEPDREMYEESARTMPVTCGLFPAALVRDRLYDVIVFNDVFEHLPELASVPPICHAHLSRDGLLVINLPNAEGALFRVASMLDRFGFGGPLQRLWQKDLPSPHLSYFTPRLLKRMIEADGFDLVAQRNVRTVTLTGLWDRIRWADSGSRSLIFAGAAFVAALGLYPVQGLLAPDVVAMIFRRRQ